MTAHRPFFWDTKKTPASIFGSIPFSSNSPSSIYRRAWAAEIRLWAGLVRGGTVLTLTGALLQAWNKKGTKG